MIEFSKLLYTALSVLGCSGLCYLANLALKRHIANLISDNEKLSDKKAELLTKLVTK